MKCRLKRREALADGFRRIIRREIDGVRSQLARYRSDGEGEAIHEARKLVKQIRAALRLIRSRLGSRLYARENRRFREAGLRLSNLRDAQVLGLALDALRKEARGRLLEAAILQLEQSLAGRRQQAAGEGFNAATLEASLKAARRLEPWPLEKLVWRDVRRGLRQTYRQGRKAFARVRAHPTDAALHEWRKRVKNLFYQLTLLDRLTSKTGRRLARTLQDLGEELGDDHDLAMLSNQARNARLTGAGKERLMEFIAARRGRLQRAALKLGGDCYRWGERGFARRAGL